MERFRVSESRLSALQFAAGLHTPAVGTLSRPAVGQCLLHTGVGRLHGQACDTNDLSRFSDAERAYLAGGRQLARIATVGADGTPHVVPVAFIYNAVRDTIDVGGHDLEQTRKFLDVARSGRVAIVVDDLASTDPWRPRGIEVRGRGEALAMPATLIRIHPERIRSWGLQS